MAKILIIDDEEVVLKVSRLVLEKAGYVVLEARSGSQAEMLCTGVDKVDLLIVDHYVGAESGRQLADAFVTRWPELKVLQISGLPRGRIEAESDLALGTRFLMKPFRPKQLTEAVQQLLS